METPKTMLGDDGKVTENVWLSYETGTGAIVVVNPDGLQELKENDLVTFRWEQQEDELNFKDITYIYNSLKEVDYNRYRLIWTARTESVTEIKS